MKFAGKIVFTITDQSKIDPYSDFELWETLTVTFERLKRSPLGAAHAVGQIYEVPPPPGKIPVFTGEIYPLISFRSCYPVLGNFSTKNPPVSAAHPYPTIQGSAPPPRDPHSNRMIFITAP